MVPGTANPISPPPRDLQLGPLQRTITMNDYDLISLPERFLSADSTEIISNTVSLSKSFGMAHRRVVSYIDNMAIPDDLRQPHFQPYLAVDETAYKLTRDGMLLTVMQLPGRPAALFRLAYINAFNDMAEKLYRRKSGDIETLLPAISNLPPDEVKKIMLACMERLTG